MQIINNTPHTINIYSEKSVDFNEKSRKWILRSGEKPVAQIEPSGVILDAKFGYAQVDEIEVGSTTVAVMERCVVEMDVFPDDGNYHIVSEFYASSLVEEDEKGGLCLTVGTPVYIGVDKPEPCGIISLKRGA